MATAVLWERLGIGKTIRRLSRSKNVPYDKALLAMVANRLCQPESKLGVWERWLDTVYLPECQDLKLRQMYEAMNVLAEHAAEIEREIFFQVANLMNLTVDVIFYDTTTVSFMVDEEDELRRYGHAKEGFWAPQVVVALAVTREGFPVKSWVFPGNTSDFTTVETVKKDLRGWNLGRALFVADAGMNSAGNRKELAKACGTYLLASRMRSVKEIGDEVLSAPGRYRKISENLFAKEVVVSTGKRYVLCFNPQEAKRQQEHRAEIVHLLEEELARHKDRDASRKWAVELLASRRFGPYLTVTDKGKLRIDRKAVQDAKRYDGKWVVETNDPTLTVEDAATGYRSLMVIERCFRSLKRTQLKIMPVYHWLPRRIEAHVKICVLALLLERMMERQAACRQGLTVRYARTSRLIQELTQSHADGSYPKLLNTLAKFNLLIIDDWLRDPLSAAQARDLLEIFDDRYNVNSTALVTQVPVAEWHQRIPDPTLADAILDRIIHNAHRLKLKGDSQRKIRSPLAENDHLTV